MENLLDILIQICIWGGIIGCGAMIWQTRQVRRELKKANQRLKNNRDVWKG